MLRILLVIGCFLAWGVGVGFCFEESDNYDLYDYDPRMEKLQIFFETEMYDEAAGLLEELITDFPDEPRFEYLKAIVDYQRGNYNQAEKIFIDFVQAYPDVAEPYYILSDIHQQKGDQEKSREYLKKYCELVPEDYEAHRKLESLADNHLAAQNMTILKDGEEDLQLVKRIGFYGACLHARKNQAIELTNGSFRNWSAMGVDFAYPVDLRGKHIILKLKGKQGGEKLELTFRDKFAQDTNPQLVLEPQEPQLSGNWQQLKVTLNAEHSAIDLSSVVHMGLEFGSSTVQNPVNCTLFVKDIIIEPH